MSGMHAVERLYCQPLSDVYAIISIPVSRSMEVMLESTLLKTPALRNCIQNPEMPEHLPKQILLIPFFNQNL